MQKIAYLLLYLIAAAAGAQSLHKWVDAQGNVSYSDRPPPPSLQVKDLSNTLNTLGAGQMQAENLPFELQQLVAKSPVVIYTSKGCSPCDLGRNLLLSKNAPFTEKIIASSADLIALGTRFSLQTLPVLTVGAKSINGFGSTQWSDALAEAGYLSSVVLPKTYVNGVTSAMTTPTSAPISAVPKATTAVSTLPVNEQRTAPIPRIPAPDSIIKFQK